MTYDQGVVTNYRSISPAESYFSPSGRVLTFPLDGLANVTAAYCYSRRLLSAYGGALYTSTGSVLNLTKNQVAGGSALDLAANVAADTNIVNAFPASIACANLTQTSGQFIGAASSAMSNFFSNSEGYIVACLLPVSFSANNAAPYSNNVCIGDNGPFGYISFKNNNLYQAYNYDAEPGDTADIPVVAGDPIAPEWWHTGGNVFGRVNAVGSGTSTASGNTIDMTQGVRWGTGGGSAGISCKINTVIYFSVTPSETIRNALVADLRSHAGF